MFRRIIYTTDSVEENAHEKYKWIHSPFDEQYRKFGSVDLLVINMAFMRNGSIDAINRRVITPDSQRKVRIIRILNLVNVGDMPSRFGGGYVHIKGNSVVITECPTEEETLAKLAMFNSIGVYIIALRSCPERVEIATKLSNSLDMSASLIDGVEASKLKIIKLHTPQEFLVVDPTEPENIYVYSKARHDKVKGFETKGMRPPQMGCSLAHLRVYRTFLKSDHKLALIFEDDTLLIPGDLEKLHRTLFYFPEDTLDYANLSDGVDWYPLMLGHTINTMYYKAIKRVFNRACAYVMNRHAVNTLFKELHTGQHNTYYLNYAADDIICHLSMTDKISVGAPYYKPFTLANIESTDK